VYNGVSRVQHKLPSDPTLSQKQAVIPAFSSREVTFGQTRKGNLARWKRWKHCSFLRQGSNFGSVWHDAARIKRWVYQSDGSDLVA